MKSKEGPAMVVTRTEGEAVIVSSNIKIEVVRIQGKQIRLRISSLDGSFIPIDREEIFNKLGGTHVKKRVKQV